VTRRLGVLVGLAAIAACGGSGESPPPMDEAAPVAPTISLADLAGTWAGVAMNEAGDSTLVEFELMATDAMDGWTMTFANRPDPAPGHVTLVDGDSVMVVYGPYSSALREGVMVTTETVIRLVNGMMEGTFVATYDMEGDNVTHGRIEGTRKQ